MDAVYAAWLGIIQGITEFLPISSSGHLILMPLFTGEDDQGVAFDLAVHIGTLLAVVLYFRNDVSNLLKDGVSSIIKRQHIGQSRRACFAVARYAGSLRGDRRADHIHHVPLRVQQCHGVVAIPICEAAVEDIRHRKDCGVPKMPPINSTVQRLCARGLNGLVT